MKRASHRLFAAARASARPGSRCGTDAFSEARQGREAREVVLFVAPEGAEDLHSLEVEADVVLVRDAEEALRRYRAIESDVRGPPAIHRRQGLPRDPRGVHVNDEEAHSGGLAVRAARPRGDHELVGRIAGEDPDFVAGDVIVATTS